MTKFLTDNHTLTLSFPMFPFDSPEKIRKPFLMFSGGSKGNIGKERVKNNVFRIFFVKQLTVRASQHKFKKTNTRKKITKAKAKLQNSMTV